MKDKFGRCTMCKKYGCHNADNVGFGTTDPCVKIKIKQKKYGRKSNI
jgi:hypothetical protein